LKRAAVSQNPAILFVHAGIDTNRPLSAQTDSFWWGAEGYTDIAPNYEGFRRIVRGFDADSVGLSLEGYAITIDNGSGNDGSLEAICLASEAEVVDRISI
jgi:serine/threonine protein phosphatase 1